MIYNKNWPNRKQTNNWNMVHPKLRSTRNFSPHNRKPQLHKNPLTLATVHVAALIATLVSQTIDEASPESFEV